MIKLKTINISLIEYVEYDKENLTVKLFMISGRVIQKQFKNEPEADNFYGDLQSSIKNTLEFN